MPRNYYYFLVVLFLFSCSAPPPEQDTTNDTISVDLYSKTFDDYSLHLQQILGKDTVPVRGVYPGMSFAEVRGVEEASHDETAKGYMRYIINFGLQENVDIEYYFSEDSTLTELYITSYHADSLSREKLLNEMVYYFDHSVEEHKKKDKEYIWEMPDYRIKLFKTGNKRNPNLQLRISE